MPASLLHFCCQAGSHLGTGHQGPQGDPWRGGLVSWPQPGLAPGSPGLTCSHPVFSKEP